MEATQQMNIRISPELKRDGDSVLARLGFTPSEGIRRMYEFLVRNQNDRKTLNAVVGIEDEEAAERARRRQKLLDFPDKVRREYAKLGIDLDALPKVHRTKEDDRNAYVEALMERYAERGLL